MGAGDLAELLRELKDRSGLSYGALAKRLHMSTSTLHRYVKGAAVPTEFAPLERLARMCGASREEMVEVHRQWILADASRGDRREGAEGEASPEVSLEGSGEPSPVTAPDVPISGGGGEEGVGDGSGSGGMGSSEPPGEPPTPGIVIGRAPTATGRRGGGWRPRGRLLVAAGVVVALGATAVAVQAASGGGDGDRVSSDSTTPHGGESERGRGQDGGRSASPSGKESGKGKPGKSGKEATGSDKKEGDSKGSEGEPGAADGGDGGKDLAGGGGGGGGGGAPVTVSTQAQFWSDPCGHPYLVDKAPANLSPPPNEQDSPGWVSANGAVSARDQTVKLTVQGTGKDTVVLESLHVRVAGTSAPLAWNTYKMGYLGVGCGGRVPQHSFDLDLDASVPRPNPQSAADNFPYKVSASDPEAFYINATANTRYVRWYLELEWSSGNRQGVVRIDDAGKPFATSGDRSRPVYAFSLNSKKWTKTNRDNDNVPDPPG